MDIYIFPKNVQKKKPRTFVLNNYFWEKNFYNEIL
jgi:hypothetical protein